MTKATIENTKPVQARKRFVKGLLLCGLMSALLGCMTTAIETPNTAQGDSCTAALDDLQHLVHEQVGTQIGITLNSLPQFRIDRVLAYLGRQSAQQLHKKALDDLRGRMAHLATQGLISESRLLSTASRQQWQVQFAANNPADSSVEAIIKHCVASRTHTPADDHLRHILQDLPAPSAYRTGLRIAGLYPLSGLAFRLGMHFEQHALQDAWLPQSPNYSYLYQPTQTVSATANSVIKVSELARDNLGLAVLTQAQQELLLRQHAPSWQLKADDSNNVPGQVIWQDYQATVDTRKPTIYGYISQSLWHDTPVLQLNYVAWFKARPKKHALDWVAGKHDGVILRINILPNGEVLAYDSIHQCGCWYHLFIPQQPTSKLRFVASAQRLFKDPLLAHTVISADRMTVTLSADEHQIIHLAPVNKTHTSSSTAVLNYTLQPFDDLLSLSTGSTLRSVFDKAGYVAGSERLERWFFWPMGIPNPGALRRPADHAIRFLGHAHFDQPGLLDEVLMP